MMKVKIIMSNHFIVSYNGFCVNMFAAHVCGSFTIFSNSSMASLKNSIQAPNGMAMIHIAPTKKATGQAKNISTSTQAIDHIQPVSDRVALPLPSPLPVPAPAI